MSGSIMQCFRAQTSKYMKKKVFEFLEATIIIMVDDNISMILAISLHTIKQYNLLKYTMHIVMQYNRFLK